MRDPDAVRADVPAWLHVGDLHLTTADVESQRILGTQLGPNRNGRAW